MNVIVNGDFADAEQVGSVGAAVALLEGSLVYQERLSLHKDGRPTDIAHAISCVGAPPPVWKPLQGAARRF